MELFAAVVLIIMLRWRQAI